MKKTVGEVKIINPKALARMSRLLVENAAETMDQQIRDVLKYGDGLIIANPTRWTLFKLALEYKIKVIRVAIAEWIGGDDLHEHCDW